MRAKKFEAVRIQFLCDVFAAVAAVNAQQQFSPNNIHMLTREMVMRFNKMITKEKLL